MEVMCYALTSLNEYSFFQKSHSFAQRVYAFVSKIMRGTPETGNYHRKSNVSRPKLICNHEQCCQRNKRDTLNGKIKSACPELSMLFTLFWREFLLSNLWTCFWKHLKFYLFHSQAVIDLL